MKIPMKLGITRHDPTIYQGALLPILVLHESLAIPMRGVVSPSVI